MAKITVHEGVSYGPEVAVPDEAVVARAGGEPSEPEAPAAAGEPEAVAEAAGVAPEPPAPRKAAPSLSRAKADDA